MPIYVELKNANMYISKSETNKPLRFDYVAIGSISNKLFARCVLALQIMFNHNLQFTYKVNFNHDLPLTII